MGQLHYNPAVLQHSYKKLQPSTNIHINNYNPVLTFINNYNPVLTFINNYNPVLTFINNYMKMV